MISKHNVLGLIFANMHDATLPEVVHNRSFASVPYLGRYRMIDFDLSAMANSGIYRVAVITKSNYQSLMDHIGTGRPWDLSRKHQGLIILPPYALGGGIYHGRVDALSNYTDFLEHSKADYVVMADCNWVHNVDLEKVFNAHAASGADVTMVCADYEVCAANAGQIIAVRADSEGRVTGMRPGREIPAGRALVSMNMMVASHAWLMEQVARAAAAGKTLFEQEDLAPALDTIHVGCYRWDGYCDLIYDLQSYYDSQLRLISAGNMADLFRRSSPINTKVRDEAPVKYVHGCRVRDSLLADGCVIEGTVENSVIYRGVHVAAGSTVRNSIVMQDSVIEKGAQLDCVIADKHVRFGEGTETAGRPDAPLYLAKHTTVE